MPNLVRLPPRPSLSHASVECDLLDTPGSDPPRRASRLPAMKFALELRLPVLRAKVFAAYRDEIVRVLEFLPSVRVVEVKAWRADGAVVEQIREWHGGGEVPAAVRGIVTQSMLGWNDHTVWDAEAFVCDWRAESHKFAEAVRCRGRTSFLEEPAHHTLLDVRGAVDVNGRRFPGVPSYLAVSVGRSVEEFLVGRIRANLVETARWFEKYRDRLAAAS